MKKSYIYWWIRNRDVIFSVLAILSMPIWLPIVMIARFIYKLSNK